MGTWAIGPFSNDAAADLVMEASEGGVSRTLTRALREAAKCPASRYLGVDEGHAAIAAAELVAISFGRGPSSDVSDDAVEMGEKLKPSDTLRLAAIEALDRVAGSGSEVIDLWKEGGSADEIRGMIADLRDRLVASSAGPVPVFRPKAGEVFVAEFDGHSFAGQVLGPKEVVIVEGKPTSDKMARDLVATASGRRVPCHVARELRNARFLGKSPISKVHKTPKHYVTEFGFIVGYLRDPLIRSSASASA